MTFDATVFRILIASPSDTTEECATIQSVLYDWNAIYADGVGHVLLPIMWEIQARPELGDRPQSIINRQIVDDCDALIGVFRARLGTPTGQAESGTVEEIERVSGAGKTVLLYFYTGPLPPDVDPDELKRVKEFKARCAKEGLLGKYSSPDELAKRLTANLTMLFRSKTTPGGAHPGLGDASSREATAQDIAAGFDAILREFQGRWFMERDSEPATTDDGKMILHDFGDALFRLMMDVRGTFPHGAVLDVQRLILATKRTQKHQVFLDGGTSYRKFWDWGNTIFQCAQQTKARIERKTPDESELGSAAADLTGFEQST